MSVYKINYLKYPRLSKDEHKRFLEYIRSSADENKDFITFGRFDRMTIDNVSNYMRSRDLSEQVKKWHGDYLSILLYDIDPFTSVVFEKDKQGKGITHIYEKNVNEGSHVCKVEGDVTNDANPTFIACTLLSFTDKLSIPKGKYREILQATKKQINTMLSSFFEAGSHDECPYEFCVLGSFGLADICIIWIANQYTDILRAVESIQCLHIDNNHLEVNEGKSIPLFGGVITSISINRNCKEGMFVAEEREIDGNALVFLSVKKENTEQQLINYLKKCFKNSTILKSFGEFDYIVEMSAQEAVSLFENGKDLHFGSDTYKDNILQTYVYLCSEVGANSGQKTKCLCEADGFAITRDRVDKINEFTACLKRIEESYDDPLNGLRTCAKKTLPREAFFVDELDAFFFDFRNSEASIRRIDRRLNFAIQFETLINLTTSKLKEIGRENIGSSSNLKGLSYIRELYSRFLDQIVTEAQSDITILDSPLCQVNYNGHQDLVLQTYYYLTRWVFSLADVLPSHCQQPECCPMINIVPVSQIKSNDFHITTKGDDTTVDKRLVHYQLPTSIMLDLPFGIISLLHESFHYVVPASRIIRNSLLWTLFLSELFIGLYSRIITKVLADSRAAHTDSSHAFDVDAYSSECYKLISEAICRDVFYAALPIILDVSSRIYLQSERINDKYQYTRHMEDSMINKLLEDSKIRTLVDSLDKEAVLSRILTAATAICKERAPYIPSELCEDISKLNTYSEAIVGMLKNDKAITAILNASSDGRDVFFDIYEIFNYYIEPFREIKADIPMIELTGIDLVEYLLYQVEYFRIVLDKPNTLKLRKNISRIGIVSFYFYMYDDREEFKSANNYRAYVNHPSIKESFIKRYIAKFIQRDYLNRDSSKQRCVKAEVKEDIIRLTAEAEQWYEAFVGLFDNFETSSIKYSIIFSNIFQVISIYNRKGINDFPEISDIKKIHKLFSDERRREEAFSKCLSGDLNTIEKSLEENKNRLVDNYIEYMLFTQNTSYYDKQSEIATNQTEENDDLKELKSVLEQIAEGYNTGHGTLPAVFNWNFEVNAENIFEKINFCSQSIARDFRDLTGEEYNGRGIWYRGQSSSQYKLLPSITRKNHDKRSIKKRLQDLYEEFRYKADGTPEQESSIAYTPSDYIALMQHFGVDTNWLDFSEDAFSALYFALSTYIDDEKKKKNRDAALYIFSPYIYNCELPKMLDALNFTPDFYSTSDLSNKVRQAFNNLRGRQSIPNLSVPHNATMFDMYIFGENVGSRSRIKNDVLFYPVAVHISRLNSRVKTQYGTFLAYNVYMEPDDGGVSSTGNVYSAYEKYDLEKIQEYYRKKIPNAKPFLYKLTIPKNQICTIAEALKAMGMSKERIYPELETVGKHVKKVFSE